MSVSTDQSDDGALGRELRRAEQRPDEAVDELVFRVDAGVLVWHRLSLQNSEEKRNHF